MNVYGLSWPEDNGEWVKLIAGRPLEQAHYEMIADASLGLALGETLACGKDDYTVVGVSRGMVSSGGDGIGFFTTQDAQAIQFILPGFETSFGQQGAFPLRAVFNMRFAVLARVIETQFSRDSSEIIQVHLRIALLRGVRTNRLPTFRTGAAIDGDPKLRRALDDVLELPERQPGQEQNDGDGHELMRFFLHELVVEADAKTGQ